MKTINYFTLLLCIFVSTNSAIAYDFQVDGLCYNENEDGNTVTLTYKIKTTPSYSSISSLLVIPSEVVYNDKTYIVTVIGDYAFMGCKLKKVIIPDSIKKIGYRAFYSCSGINSVTIGNSVERIGSYAFGYCRGLTSVIIPNSVTSIGNRAFLDCSGLTSVTIGNSVKTIEECAFEGCNGLTQVETTDLAAWCNISFSETSGANPLYYAKHLFLNGTEVKDLVIPDSVKLISSGAFIDCYGFTSVTIPNSVISIGNSAFSGCRNITTVSIGENVASIGISAFYSCVNLLEVTNYAEFPQSIDSSVFHGNEKGCILYVLEESYEYYINADYWKNFIIRVAGIDGAEVDAATKEVEGYYNLQGIRLNEPDRGQVNIVRYTDGTSKKIIIE